MRALTAAGSWRTPLGGIGLGENRLEADRTRLLELGAGQEHRPRRGVGGALREGSPRRRAQTFAAGLERELRAQRSSGEQLAIDVDETGMIGAEPLLDL